MHTMMTKFRFALMIALAIPSSTYAQSDVEEPSFRARTDANAAEDLKRLREELSRASDANGAINPLGKFLDRGARTNEPARLEVGPSDPQLATRELEPASSKPKPRREIGTLPGPRFTIIQQASPQTRIGAVDGFRPARLISDIDATIRPSLQYPVTMASANLPIVGQPTSTIANYQSGPEIPPSFGSTPGIGLPQPVFNNQPGFNTNTQPVLPSQQVLPGASSNPLAPIYPNGGMPSAGAPTFSSPIQDTQPMVSNPGGFAVPQPTYSAPIYSAPYNNPQAYNQTPQVYPNQGFGNPGSPSDTVRPTYNPSRSFVNGAPFVSNGPRPYDARNMVDCNVYRQSVDPCAQPYRGNPNGYASSPYATGGSPFSYVPQTSMPYGKSSGYRPLIGFGQNSYDPFLGRGIIGQPVAYVDGQPVRNFIRYIFP